MGRGIRMGVFWQLGVVLLLLATTLAHADDSRRLVKLAAGEEVDAWGVVVKASAPSVLLLSLSSEFSTVAVLDGAVTQGDIAGQPGDALVTALDGGKTRQLQFDARRLVATLQPDWLAEVKAPLGAVAAKQAKQRFWGLVQPVNLNANAPASAQMEGVRQSYLGNPTIASLRRESAGNTQLLASLTATRFAAAVAASDTSAIADLIDPLPFTETGAEAASWQLARDSFAQQVADDGALKRAMAAAPVAVANDQTAFDAGGYRIHVVPRDRAMFVSAVEAL